MLSIRGVGLSLQDAMQPEQQERKERTGAGDYKNYSHHNTDAHHIILTHDTHSSTLFKVLTKTMATNSLPTKHQQSSH